MRTTGHAGGAMIRAAAALIAILAIQGAAMAAEGGGPPARPGRPGNGQPPTREELREAMEGVMIERLKEALRLTPAQEPRVIPRVEEMLAARREHAARQRPALRRLRHLLAQEPPDQGRIREALLDLRDSDAGFRAREAALRDAAFDEMTPWQQGRFLIFVERFRRQMQRRLQAAAPGPPRPGGAGRRQTAPAADDPLDDPGGWEEE